MFAQDVLCCLSVHMCGSCTLCCTIQICFDGAFLLAIMIKASRVRFVLLACCVVTVLLCRWGRMGQVYSLVRDCVFVLMLSDCSCWLRCRQAAAILQRGSMYVVLYHGSM